MKNNMRFYGLELLLLVIASMVFAVATRGQSSDMDTPTALTSNVITGEGDGKGESQYYTFAATPGDLKVTVDARTDRYSTPLEVALLTEDGKELLEVTVVAGDKMARGVGTKHFVREQNVILRISTREDKEVKLLMYKIKLDGAIKIDVPATVSTRAPASAPAPATPSLDVAPASAAGDTTPGVAASPAADGAAAILPAAPAKQPPAGTKAKIKDKAKTTAKDAVKKILGGP